MTKKTILIATSVCATAETWGEFVKIITNAARDLGVALTKPSFVDGPGCANFAFIAEGSEEAIETCGNHLCMALMPARWTYTSDEPVEGFHIKSKLN